MGRFSTTVHIKNDVDRMRFVNTFCDVMKKRGFAPCTEDEAAVSYCLAFGEGWVTLANEDYKNDPQKSSEDIREMAKALKTSAFSVEVVDSDFAIMTLCAANGTEDRVVVGDGSGYGVDEAEGDRKLWEPLLADGKTWEEFSEAAAAQGVFVEDALDKVASVIGIDPYYMVADHDEVLAKADGNNNVTAFYFKKAQGKAMSLNTAFIKVFGEGLEPLGFKKIKSKYPYFVRVVPGGEIIHAITMGKVPNRGYEFVVKCGIATVYCGSIDLTRDPYQTHWHDSIFYIGGSLLFNEILKNEAAVTNIVTYKYSDDTLIGEMELALKDTLKIIPFVLNCIVDIKACVKYFSMRNCFFSRLSLREAYECIELERDHPRNKECEGLLWVLLNDREFYKEMSEKYFNDELKRLKMWINSPISNKTKSDYDDYLAKMPQLVADDLAYYDSVFSDKEWLRKAHTELNNRKSKNFEALKSFGLSVE